MVVEEWEYHHSTRLDEPVRMVVSHSSTNTGRRDIRRNVKWRSTESDKDADLITFRQISLRPVVVEEWEYHHSTRLDEPVRMVVF